MEPQSTAERQQALIDVARDLSRTENVEQLLDQILECSRKVMACEVCSILLPESSTGDLILRSTMDEPGQKAIPTAWAKKRGIPMAVIMSFDGYQKLKRRAIFLIVFDSFSQTV